MNTAAIDDPRREQQFNAILLPLVKALEHGQAPDRQALLAAHPEFAGELEEFFAGHDCLDRLNLGELAGRNPPGPARNLGQLGDFRLLREIGRGGMGVVYEAQQISLDRCVALKMLPYAAGLDPRQLQRFKNEAHAAALLHHPHIVPIYSVGCERDVHYYAMQFIQGRSLAAMIRGLREPPPGADSATTQGGAQARPAAPPSDIPTARLAGSGAQPVSDGAKTPTAAGMSTARSTWRSDFFRRAAQLGIEAAEALEHAHQVGVVHRDIKPANLLLDMRGELWITDFGVALLQRSEGMTRTGEMIGTLRYMSPEQAGAERGHIDHRTDIYSLGATLYELLTLEPAFPSNDPHQLMQQIASEDPRPLRSLDQSIPVDLELIVLKALAKNPAERYGTAKELADDLRRFLEDKPVQATRPSLVDRAVKWSRRHKAVVVSALILLILTTAGSLLSTVLISRSHGEATAAFEREKLKTQEVEHQRVRAEKNLAHARQVVAFLTQISAEEMSDSPELLPVREKLLTAALRYYEQFIKDHHDDPTIRAELDASSAQVKQILNVLAAQQDYTRLMMRVMLLEEKDVKHDLGLKPMQRDKLWELLEQLKEQRGETMRTSLKLSHQERGKRFQELADRNEKFLAAILTAGQARRLKQIALQQQGVYAFGETEVADGLRLSTDQKATIRMQLDQLERSQKAIHASMIHPPEIERHSRELHKTTETKILVLLTPEQKTRWQTMSGEVFDGEIHFIPRNAFSPAGPAEFRPPPPPPEWNEGPPPDDWWKGKKDGPPPYDYPPKKKKF